MLIAGIRQILYLLIVKIRFMEKIIVPVDFSEYSEFALQTAAMLAKKYSGEILALHMLELNDSLLSSDEDKDEKSVFYLKLAEKRFNEFLDKDYLKGVSVRPMIKNFKVFSEVAKLAEDRSVDMIIMGSHGASGMNEFFVGTNTERVVRHSEVPVLVVKGPPLGESFDKVVFVTNFDDEAVEVYLRSQKLFNDWGTEVHFVYVNLPNADFRSSKEIDDKVTDFLLKAEGNLDALSKVNYISDYTIEDGVFEFAHKIDADLIAIPTHGRTGLSHFFSGSITEDIANHSILPVITFKI